MKKFILLNLSLAISLFVSAQDLPKNPKPGKCYVRCTTPDVYVNENVEVMITPAYKKLKIVPATFKTVTEKIMVKAEGKKLTIIPEVWGTETKDYVKKEKYSTLKINEATFNDNVKKIKIHPEYALWELGASAPDCASGNPGDCRYWCYKSYPAEFVTVPLKTLNADASSDRIPVPEVTSKYTKKIVTEQARVVEKIIPAVYSTVKKTVMVEKAHTTEVTVPAVYKTVTKEILQKKGGLTSWKEVECKLLEYSNLNINWNLGSALLTPAAKKEIDVKLLPLLAQGISVEIASHTDSRGSKENNRILSEKRAQSVTNYLIIKGINSSRIISNGYGESKLLNRCSDGVSCTEKEHRANRRTQFRIIP